MTALKIAGRVLVVALAAAGPFAILCAFIGPTLVNTIGWFLYMAIFCPIGALIGYTAQQVSTPWVLAPLQKPPPRIPEPAQWTEDQL